VRKIALLVCILALAMCASAQTLITFSNLTPSTSPTPVPNGYSNLNWEQFYSVDPLQWGGSGPGFTNGPDAVIAFVGGNFVCFFQPAACKATISSSAALPHFQAQSASVSAGYQQNVVTFVAYLGGVEVGRKDYTLTVTNQIINFPASWGTIDQLKIWPNPTAGAYGSTVFYTLTIQPEP
jgi:hypothetical protein